MEQEDRIHFDHIVLTAFGIERYYDSTVSYTHLDVYKRQAIFSAVGCLAGVAQLAEQLICNQQFAGSSPIAGSTFHIGKYMGRFPSGQREQTRCV